MKFIENCTLEELKALLENYTSYYKIEIAYGFFHRDKTYVVQHYANSKAISVSTLYRYVNEIKLLYNEHSK